MNLYAGCVTCDAPLMLSAIGTPLVGNIYSLNGTYHEHF